MPFPCDFKALFILILLPALIAILIGMALPAINRARTAAGESAQRALFAEVVKNLHEYAEANHKYPETINALNITNYQDGSSPSMLSFFQYTSDGYSCPFGERVWPFFCRRGGVNANRACEYWPIRARICRRRGFGKRR